MLAKRAGFSSYEPGCPGPGPEETGQLSGIILGATSGSHRKRRCRGSFLGIRPGGEGPQQALADVVVIILERG